MMSMSPLTIGEHSSGGGGFIEYFEGGKSGKGSKGSSTYAYGGGKSSKGNSGTYAYTSHVDVIDVAPHSGDTTTHGDIDIEYAPYPVGKSGKGSKGSSTYAYGGKASKGGGTYAYTTTTSHVDVIDVVHSGDTTTHGDVDIEYVETSSGGKSGKGGYGGKASKGGGNYAYTTSHVDVIDVAHHSGDTTTTHGDIDIEYVETSSGGKSGKGSYGGKASKGGGTYAYTATTNHYEIVGGPVDVDHSGGHWEGGTDHGGQIEEVVPVATNPNWN
jgi:hypothetical protein